MASGVRGIFNCSISSHRCPTIRGISARGSWRDL